MAERLLAIRLRQRDLTLDALQRDIRTLWSATPLDLRAQAATDRALSASLSIDFRFRARIAADALTATTDALAHYRRLVRQVAASFSTDRDRRAHLIDALAQAVARTTEPAQHLPCA